jgi:Zn-dependent M28 family amino/carboxypeptidase
VVPGFGSDSVFNGARDNAAGVAVLLGAAEALRAMPQAPRRSVLFVAVTAAEGAQRDPASLTKQVPVAPEHITAVVNVERPDLSHDPPMISDVDGADAGLIGALEAAAHQEGVQVAPWRGLNPGRQTLVHVAFARLGVPGLTILGGSGRSGPDSLYYATRYHQSSDEFDPDARLDGLRAQARTVARLTRLIADADDAAAWSPDSPYRAAWERLERRRMRRPGR